jgi:serine/threonine protein phosphatase PrpC
MSQPVLEFDYSASAITGARPYQEDTFQVWRPNTTASKSRPLLAVLADGMGGHVSGEVASRLAAGHYIKAFSSEQGSVDQRLEHSLHAGNDALSSAIRNDGRLAGMGCTIVAAYIDQDGLRWASVGDSMLLLFRDNQLKRLNADHSFGALLDKQAEANIISLQEAKQSPQRHTLRSALTGSPIPIRQVEARPYALRSGDWIVLASDGLDTLSGNAMAQLVGQHEDGEPAALVEALLKAVAKEGVANQDNTTVVAIRVLDMDDLTTQVLLRRGAATAASSAPPQAAGSEGVDATNRVTASRRAGPRLPMPRAAAFLILLLCLAAAVGIAIQGYMATRSSAPTVEAAKPASTGGAVEQAPTAAGEQQTAPEPATKATQKPSGASEPAAPGRPPSAPQASPGGGAALPASAKGRSHGPEAPKSPRTQKTGAQQDATGSPPAAAEVPRASEEGKATAPPADGTAKED